MRRRHLAIHLVAGFINFVAFVPQDSLLVLGGNNAFDLGIQGIDTLPSAHGARLFVRFPESYRRFCKLHRINRGFPSNMSIVSSLSGKWAGFGQDLLTARGQY
jgi:hypothetical protein